MTYLGFSPQAQAAFQAAVDLWAPLVSSSETVRVQANWTSLDPGVLGSARSNFIWRNFLGASFADTWFADALADALGRADLGAGDFDIIANFNSDLPNWYLGTDGNTPAGQYDFVTVVLHEIGHGLGFAGSMRVDDGDAGNGVECAGVAAQGCYGFSIPADPAVYDWYSENGMGQALLGFSSPSLALGSQLVGGDLFFDAPGANGANGGLPPELYAPATWDPGSSYSHLDETTFGAGDPDSLMTPFLALAESIQDPGPIALCMLEDSGWVTAESCAGGGGGSNVLYNQAANCGGSSAPSQVFTDIGNSAVEAADDFVVPGGEVWAIETVFDGIFGPGAGPVDSVNITFYADGASPGSPVCSYPSLAATPSAADSDFTLTLPSPCLLGPGTYWISAQAVMAFNPNGQWFWLESQTALGASYEWRDPAGLFGVGCADWTDHVTCTIGGVANDLCFGLLGEDVGAVVIFVDGFEGGDLSAWSSSVP